MKKFDIIVIVIVVLCFVLAVYVGATFVTEQGTILKHIKSQQSPVRKIGIQLKIETTNTKSETILTGGKTVNGVTEWGEIYMSEAGYVAVESIDLPMKEVKEAQPEKAVKK